MKASSLGKYIKKSQPTLIALAQNHFNEYIRNRDEGKPCISCGRYYELQAGHYYSAGHYPELRFDENNVHGQCVHCNMYLSGNLIEYRKGLIKKIGEKEVERLDLKVAICKRTSYRFDRIGLIEIIETYKERKKNDFK